MTLPNVLSIRYARLTDAWQPLNSLKINPHDGDYGFADLVWLGMAEVRRDTIIRHGIACGTNSFYRRAGK